MKITKMKLSELKSPEHNIRIHTEKQLIEFERSIKMFGQIRPIVVDEENTILCGNGLYATLIRMGAESADVYKIKDLTENQKKKLMIADNKIYGLGIDDLETFNQFLTDLSDDLDIPGFDEEILRSMVAEAEEVTARISEYGTISEEEIQAIQANKEKKDTLISNALENTENHFDAHSQNIQSPNTSEMAQVKKSVICPECGCEIWL